MDEFLDLPQHIWEFATTEEHNKQEISVEVGVAVDLV